jgi:hypothetical protein
MRGGACLALVLASCTLAAGARAEPLRLLLAVSNSRGAPGESPLHHAAEDAERVRAVFTSLGGVRPEDAVVLSDPGVVALDAAFDRARARAATHRPDEVTFVFYFSGHGDRARVHLGDESLEVQALTDRIRAMPAALRVVVTDACRTFPARTKGVTTEPGFAITAPESTSGGTVWLFAASEGEPALESDELHGALFTHYWVSALRGAGDANGDGNVTLAESYDFAYSQTLLRSAHGAGVLQHPAAILDLHEAAPIVLTRTSDGATSLRFPRARDAHYLVYAVGARAVVAEVWGSEDHEATLAVPAGRYLIERRGASAAAAVEVTLARGDTRSLAPGEFRAAQAEELASKGGEAVILPNELGLGLGVWASRIASIGEEQSVHYARSLGGWAVGVDAALAFGRQSTSANHVGSTLLGGDLTLERRWRTGPWTFGLGFGADAQVIWQRVTRQDASRVSAAGYPTSQLYDAFAPGPEVDGRVRLSFGPRLWADAALTGSVLWANMGGSSGPLWGGSLGLGAGVSF